MIGSSLPTLIKYTNSYEMCLFPLGRLKETHLIHHVVIIHCTKAQVLLWRLGYQVTWTLSKVDSSFGPEGVRFRESWLYNKLPVNSPIQRLLKNMNLTVFWYNCNMNQLRKEKRKSITICLVVKNVFSRCEVVTFASCLTTSTAMGSSVRDNDANAFLSWEFKSTYLE